MLGLAIAAVIFLFSFLGSEEDAPILASVAVTFPFLFYWHWTWAVVKGLLVALLGLVGIGGMASKDGKDKTIGATILIASPVVFVMMALGSVLFIGSIICLQRGISDTGELVSQKHAIAGAVIYGIGIFLQLVGRVSGSTSKKD